MTPQSAWPVVLARCAIPVMAVAYVVDLVRQTRDGLTNGDGRPLGDDFINYWSAAVLSAHGRAREVYDWTAFHAFHEILTGSALDFYHYSYPPILLLLTAPLATLPYVPALAAWLISGWLSFFAALRMTMPARHALLLALASPAVFINAVGGQNGTFTAALVGGGLSLLDRRPVIAGLMLGLLSYKPHLGILIPVALLAGRRWQAMAAASVTVVSLVALTLCFYPPEIWTSFAHNAAILRQQILEDGTGVWHRMVSVFVFCRRLAVDVGPAYALQAVAGLAAAGCVALIWLRDAPRPLANAALVLGTLLATPYLQDYDLVVGAFVVAWLTTAELPAGVRPISLIALAPVIALPAVAAPVAAATGIAIGPLLIIPGFCVVVAAALKRGDAATTPANHEGKNLPTPATVAGAMAIRWAKSCSSARHPKRSVRGHPWHGPI
jgi:arabinofuranan 3-O-arabinosyltransferase